MNTNWVTLCVLMMALAVSAPARGEGLQTPGTLAAQGSNSARPAGSAVPGSAQAAKLLLSARQASSLQSADTQSQSISVAGQTGKDDALKGSAREQSAIQPFAERSSSDFAADLNREIYYKNKLELGLEVGVLPINTPMLVGPIFGYSLHRPRKGWAAWYTLIPTIAMLRWQLYNPMGPSFLRGNTEFLFGGTYTAITEGRESIFAGPLTGVRYNFIQPNWKLVPYADLRVGLGYTDAYQPYQKSHHLRTDGQGQDFTFTFILTAGLRYNFSPHYSASLGFMAMHISNMYLSEPEYYNHGVNVIGPTVGFNVGLNDLLRKIRL